MLVCFQTARSNYNYQNDRAVKLIDIIGESGLWAQFSANHHRPTNIVINKNCPKFLRIYSIVHEIRLLWIVVLLQALCSWHWLRAPAWVWQCRSSWGWGSPPPHLYHTVLCTMVCVDNSLKWEEVSKGAAKAKSVHLVQKAWNMVQMYKECWSILLLDAGCELSLSLSKDIFGSFYRQKKHSGSNSFTDYALCMQ